MGRVVLQDNDCRAQALACEKQKRNGPLFVFHTLKGVLGRHGPKGPLRRDGVLIDSANIAGRYRVALGRRS